jgi:hypothetical protein
VQATLNICLQVVLHSGAKIVRNVNFSDIILNLKTLRSAKTLNLIQSCNSVTGKLNLSWVKRVNRQYQLCLSLQDPKVMTEVLPFPLLGNNIMYNFGLIMLITFCKRSNKLHRDNLTSSILHVPLLSIRLRSQCLFNHYSDAYVQNATECLSMIRVSIAHILVRSKLEQVSKREPTLWNKPTKYKACPSESGPEVGAPLLPAVELCNKLIMCRQYVLHRYCHLCTTLQFIIYTCI